MAFAYPISLEVGGRRAVVIGRDAVVQGKADSLIEAGARVTIIAEGPQGPLARLKQEAAATVLRRRYRRGDLEGAFLCVASSEDSAERDAIAREARSLGVLVNVMDDIPNCDFAAPAVVRRGDLVISISTGARSPALARRLRVELSRRFGPEWKDFVELLGEVRTETLADLPEIGERSRRWQQALDVDALLALIKDGRRDEARSLLLSRLVGVGAA